MSETTIYMKHRVEGATLDLIIPVALTINVPDEVIAANVRANTRRVPRHKRVRTAKPHDAIAIMCGSGPSLAKHLGDIRALRHHGEVFALNGTASYLAKNDMIADWQVIVDARPRTAELVGPAFGHLFASQCDPACFDAKPQAMMWHFINGELDQQLPDDEPAHAQIGGAGSVGNCAMALAWAMGYRRFEVFGYDSSHSGNDSHAFHQPLNDFEPWGRFTFNGREYICSYTMRSQASRFQLIGRELIRNGCIVNVHGDGLLQDMWRAPFSALSEVEKYERMWLEPDYRAYSPGEESAFTFVEEMAPDGPIIDFGCGTGRGGLAIHKLTGQPVTLVDFAGNCLDPGCADMPFVVADLTRPLGLEAPYGYCTDVMEHIPPADVDAVITNIMAASPKVFFQVSTVPDRMGALIERDLHLTVQPGEWWRQTFERLGLHVAWSRDRDLDVQLIIKRTP